MRTAKGFVGKIFLLSFLALFICILMSGCQSRGNAEGSAFKPVSADSGDYRITVTECVSDTHYTSFTVEIGRVDGEPVTETDDISAVYEDELIYPDMMSWNGEVAFGRGKRVYKDGKASGTLSGEFEDGNALLYYEIYTNPIHESISISYSKINGEPADVSLTFEPEPEAIRSISVSDGETGVESILISERSLLIRFTLPEGESPENPVKYELLDKDGNTLVSGEETVNRSGRLDDGTPVYALHGFFEEGTISLDNAAAIRVNGAEFEI